MYNLNEEEELTHYGQSLAEMEKFNDLVNSDDESEEKGLLSGEHFLCPNTRCGALSMFPLNDIITYCHFSPLHPFIVNS